VGAAVRVGAAVLAAFLLLLPAGPASAGQSSGGSATAVVPPDGPGATQGPGVAATPVAATSTVSAPALLLASQTPWVTPAQPTFDLALRTGPGAPASSDLGVSVAVYPCLTSVSSLDLSLAAAGPQGTPLSATTSPLPWGALRPTAGGVQLPLQVDATTFGDAAITPGNLVVHLRSGTGTCQEGVFPVRLVLVDTATGTDVGSLTTDLLYVTSPPAYQTLRVALVLPLDTVTGPARDPSVPALLADPFAALAPAPAGTLSGLGQTMAALAASPTVPVTVAASGQTVQLLDAHGHQATVAAMAALAADPSAHQFTAAPYTQVDASALVDAGLGSELASQVARGAQLLDGALIDRSPTPSTAGGTGVWFTDGGLDDATANQLAGLGYHQLVVPPSALTSSPVDGSGAVPFTLGTSQGSALAVLASNPDVTDRFTADPGDPVLAASQILAVLAQIYFEQPNLVTPRVVVAVPPTGWAPLPALVQTLLGGLQSSTILRGVTVAQAFQALPAKPCSAGCRLLPPAGSGLPAGAVRTERGRIDSLASALVGQGPGRPAPTQALGDLVLASESDALRPAQQTGVLTNTRSAVDARIGQISLSGDQSITLTARKGQVPVTISKSPALAGPVTGLLTLSSDKLLFANGTSRYTRTVTLTTSTNSFYIGVVTRASGEFKLTITLQAPAGGLILTSGVVTIRSTATSIVGVLLSVGAVLVLAAWWVRTGIRRRAEARADDDAGPP
jgi:hypothetical protein